MWVNLFEQALDKDELFDFAMGEGKYFIRDREYGEHWVLKSWLDHIVPFVHTIDYDRGQNSINALFESLVRGFKNKSQRHEILLKILYHVYVFYYARDEDRLNDNFIIEAEPKITSLIDSYKAERIGAKSNLKSIDIAIAQIKKKGGLSAMS